MKILFNIFILFFCGISFAAAKPDKPQSSLNPDSVIYRKSWETGVRLSSNGFSLGAEFTKAKRFKKSILFQTRFSYFWDPKQSRQQSQYGGGGIFGGDGFKPFVYGKQNTLFTLYGGVGQKFLLAEKGKKHGVQLFFKYAGGFVLAILKPYSLKIVPPPITGEFTEDDIVDVTYQEGVDNSFLDYNRIIGASGFGKGWKLKALPGLHIEAAIEFDWAKNEGLIKALEIGVAADFYYKKVPVMVQKNNWLYPSVFAGFMLGKRKER